MNNKKNNKVSTTFFRYKFKPFITVLLASILLLFSGGCFANTDFFVDAENGDDKTGVGSKELPWRTIAHASDEVAVHIGLLPKRKMVEDIIVYLRAGRFELAQPLALNKQHSGNNGFTITYRNFENEMPVISGGKILSGWHYDEAIDIDETDANNKTVPGFYLDIDKNFNFRQLYVNGSSAIRARTPTHDWLHATSGQWETFTKKPLHIHHISLSKDNDGLPGQDNEISQLLAMNKESVVRVEYIQLANWRQHRVRISSVEQSSDTVKLHLPDDSMRRVLAQAVKCCGGRTAAKKANKEGVRRGAGYRLENALAFMDDEREWFLDRESRRLYYIPAKNEIQNNTLLAEVIAPVTDKLLVINGVKNVVFYGLTFEHASYLKPDKYGVIQRMAGLYFDVVKQKELDDANKKVTRPPVSVHTGGIELVNTDNVHFERNRIQNFDANGVVLYEGVKRSAFKGNVFTQNGVDHLVVYGNNKAKATAKAQVKDLAITDNYMVEPGATEQMGMSIFASYPTRMIIENNLMADSDQYAINVGWGAHKTGKMPSLADNAIRFNEFKNLMRFTQDAAVIHTKSATNEGVLHTNITENYVHDFTDTRWGKMGFGAVETRLFYLDDRTNRAVVTHNVVENIPAVQSVAHLQGIKLGLAENNILDFNYNLDTNKYLRSVDGKHTGLEYSGPLTYTQLRRAKSIKTNAGLSAKEKFISEDEDNGLLGTSSPTANEAGLVGKWSFDIKTGNARYLDSGPYNYHGDANYSHVSLASIDGDRSLFLKEETDSVNISKFKGIEHQEPRTVSTWLRTSEKNGTILSWGDTKDKGLWAIGLKNGRLFVDVQGGFVRGQQSIADNQWHHIAVVWENDGSPNIIDARLYVDGQLQKIHAKAGSVVKTASKHQFRIGANKPLGLVGLKKTRIDNLKVYRRALHNYEVVDLAGRKDLVASWNFEGNLADISGQKHHLKTNQKNRYLKDSAQGRQALHLSNKYQAVSKLPKAIDVASVSAWVKTEANSGTMVSWKNETNGNAFNLGLLPVQEHGILTFAFNKGKIAGNSKLNDGAWHQVTLTWAADRTPTISDVKLFVDGVPEKVTVLKNTTIPNMLTDTVVLGEQYHGAIDGVRMSKRVISPREVYNSVLIAD